MRSHLVIKNGYSTAAWRRKAPVRDRRRGVPLGAGGGDAGLEEPLLAGGADGVPLVRRRGGEDQPADGGVPAVRGALPPGAGAGIQRGPGEGARGCGGFRRTRSRQARAGQDEAAQLPLVQEVRAEREETMAASTRHCPCNKLRSNGLWRNLRRESYASYSKRIEARHRDTPGCRLPSSHDLR